MTYTCQDEKTTILHLRVRSESLDPQAVQLRATNLFELTDLRLPGLPSGAVLCVRRLYDPLPGWLRLDGKSVLLPLEWEQSVRESLDRLAHQAIRPALGMVPSQAEAVLFSDRAELLACLAADWLKGELGNRWWWQALLSGRPFSQAILQAWLEAPEYIPAALEHLAVWKMAVDFGLALAEIPAWNLLQVLVAHYGLRELQGILQAPASQQLLGLEVPQPSIPSPPQAPQPVKEPLAALTPTLQEAALPGELEAPGSRQSQVAQAPPPWSWRAPEGTAPGLGHAAAALLGIGLLLARSPYEVRRSEFAVATRTWWTAARPPGPVTSSASPRATEQPQPSFTDSRSSSRRDTPKAAQFLGEETQPAIRFNPSMKDRSLAVEFPPRGKIPPAGESFSSAQTFPQQSQLLATPPIAGASLTQAVGDFHPAGGDLQPNYVETCFGGLFYLLDAALALGLYRDFTLEQTDLALSPWDFLALIGRRLLGQPLLEDPLWALLAQLAGRPLEVSPGTGFTPPEAWRLPAPWLAEFSSQETWLWSASQGRLRLWHPAGFYILDIPLLSKKAAQAQLSAELQEYSPVGEIKLRHAVLKPFVLKVRPISRWLDWLEPYLRQRLALALNLAQPETLPAVLCAYPARIGVSKARVEVHLALAKLPIEIRLAGLDRDLGWLPAAGYDIRFIYE